MKRRALLTAAAASAMLPGAVMAGGGGLTASPDAELIAVCREFDACERQTCIIHGTGPGCVADDREADAASLPLFDRMTILLDRMDELRATTAAGIQARAHSLAQHGGSGQHSFDCEGSIVGRLLVYVMRDSAALADSPLPVKPSPDAGLLEACAAFHQAEADQVASDAAPGWDEAEINALGQRWYEAVGVLLAAPAPQTAAGRVALAGAARVALMDLANGNAACAEQQLAVKALEGWTSS